MKQEDKELLLKDLCVRLPYGVKVNNEIQGDFKIYGICENFVFGRNEACHIDFDIEKIKPYLFPMSSITPEQEKELSKLGVSYGEYALHDDIRGLGIMVDEAYIFFEFCYKHHIDFLGLIEKSLAIDATGLNIY